MLADQGGAQTGHDLPRALLFALLSTQHQDRAGEDRQRPLQVLQLLLCSGDVRGCLRSRLGRSLRGLLVTLRDLAAQRPALSGRAEGRPGYGELGHGVRPDAGLTSPDHGSPTGSRRRRRRERRSQRR